MFKNKFRLKRRARAFEDIHYSCSVQFLDDSPPLSVTYQKDTKGQYLIDYVCQSMDLIERDYFGLRYVNQDKQRCWLDPAKPVHGQIKGIPNPVLCFRVKYYPSDSSKLKEEITRYQVFLQVKKDLQRGRLLCSKEDAIELCGYVVQSELGDYDPEEHLPNYISEMKNLPKIVEGSEKAISEQHKMLTGKVPAEAETEFLKKATDLESYGMDPHIVMDMKGTQLYLAINYHGITTFQNHQRTHYFKWPQIKRMSFEGRLFIVRLFSMDNEDAALMLKRYIPTPNCGLCNNAKKQPTCGFKCESVAASKYLWKCAMEQKFFFTLQSTAPAPKVVSSGGLFHRGSKLRFSGRCEKEVHSSTADITRDEPRFIRTPSNADFAKTYQSMRSATLPASWRQNNACLPSEEQIAVLEMNLSEPLFGDVKEIGLMSTLVETVLESDEEGEKKAAEDDEEEEEEKEDEGIATEPEASEPSTDVVVAPSPAEYIIEETVPSESCRLEMKFVSPVEQPEPREDDSLAADYLISQPELDPEIQALQTQLQNMYEDGNHVGWTEEYDYDSEPPPVYDTSQEGKELDADPSTVPVTSFVSPLLAANRASRSAAPRRRWCRVCYRITVALFIGIVVLLLIAIFVLESKVDFPVVGHIRLLPAVEDFRVQHYIPLRNAAEEVIHGLLGI